METVPGFPKLIRVKGKLYNREKWLHRTRKMRAEQKEQVERNRRIIATMSPADRASLLTAQG